MTKQLSRRHFLKMSGAAAAAGLLAACAPQAAPQSGGQASGGASSAGVKLKWDTFRGPGTGWNEDEIKSFKEKNPNVDIEFRPLTGASQQDNYGKMYALFAAGDLGDICAFDPSHFHFWRAINKNIIGPIDDLVAADKLDLKQWYDKFIALQMFKGKQYGLPSWGWAGQDTMVINAVQFEAAGEKLPDPKAHDTSMDQYAEWAHKFFKDGEHYGLGMVFDEGHLVTLTRAFNGDLINEDGTKCLLATDKNAQDGLRWAYKLAVEDKVLPRPADVTDMAAAILGGKLTIQWGGSLDARNFKRGIKDEKVAKAAQGLLPTRQDGQFPCQTRGGTWNILKGSKHPQEAYAFIKHITTLEGCISFNLKAGQGALVRPDVVAELIKQDPIHEWFIPNLEKGMPANAPANSRGREYTDACVQWATKMMDPKENIPFDKGLQDLNDNIQKVLDMEPA